MEGTVGDDDNAAWASAATRLCGNSPRQHQPNAPHQQHADRHPTLAQVTDLQPDFAEALGRLGVQLRRTNGPAIFRRPTPERVA